MESVAGRYARRRDTPGPTIAPKSNSDGVPRDRRHEPDEQLENQGASREEEDGGPLAEAVGEEGEREAADGDTRPKSGGDETDF